MNIADYRGVAFDDFSFTIAPAPSPTPTPSPSPTPFPPTNLIGEADKIKVSLLSATTAVWRTFSNTYGYAFETNDLGPADHAQPKITFYAHPNRAAGTVPFYRFRRQDSANHEYFYSQSTSYDGHGWVLDGTAFYVYPDAATPGTLPLYLYHDNQFHYFLTINQSEATGMALDGIAA